MELEELDADDVRPLRTRVLRPHFPAGKLATFEGDDAPDTKHYGLVDADGEPAAVTSYMREPAPDDLGDPATRLRGMAVREDRRGEGLGSRLLQGSLTRLAVAQPDLAIVWCNVRTSAEGFYRDHGFEPHGEVFEVDEIGPHIVMWRQMPTTFT